MNGARWAATLLCAGIAGCSSSDARSGAGASAPSEANAIVQVSYACADDRRIDARYDNSDPARSTARLVIDGRRFDLYHVISGSGARYATENGLQPDHGLQWWTKGHEATLSEMLMDHTAGGPVELTTCTAMEP